MQVVQRRNGATDTAPQQAGVGRRAVGEREILCPGQDLLREREGRKVAARARVHHERRADGNANLAAAECHSPRHDAAESRHAAAILRDPRRQLVVAPRIGEEDVAHVRRTVVRRRPRVVGEDGRREPDDGRDVGLGERTKAKRTGPQLGASRELRAVPVRDLGGRAECAATLGRRVGSRRHALFPLEGPRPALSTASSGSARARDRTMARGHSPFGLCAVTYCARRDH